jgi:hypothetical protein
MLNLIIYLSILMQILCAQQPKLFEAETDDKSEDLNPLKNFH